MMIQAGSAFWRIVPEAEDTPDGQIPFFGYQWPGPEKAREQLSQEIIPEMHVWAILPHRTEVVDIAAGFQPAQAAKLGLEWRTSKPPPYFWNTSGKLFRRHGVIYMPDQAATKIVHGLLDREAHRLGMKPLDQVRKLVRVGG